MNALVVGAVALAVWHKNPSLGSVTLALLVFLIVARKIALQKIRT
jgi:hypothetical protein